MDIVRREVEARPIERYQEPWVAWPVAWNAIWVGALAALAAALIIGLLGVALGAHELVPPRRVVRVRDFGFGAALFSVVGALLAFGAGGWVASKIAGLRRAVAGEARDAVNTWGLNGLRQRHHRQDGGESPCQHRLAISRRADGSPG
jgi:hypothetical protein